MVAQVHAVPGLALQLHLPAVEDFPHLRQRRAVVAPLAQLRAVVQRVVVLEGEDHVQLAAVVGGVADGLFGCAARLAHGQQVVLVQHALAHLAQVAVGRLRVLVAALAVAVDLAGPHGAVVEVLLADHGNHVHAEAVHTLVAPPGHHVVDLVAHLRVGPVEVGLLAAEQVQVILAGGLVELPRALGEVGAPVVRRAAVRLGIAPDVVVAVGIVAALAALHEPRMLVRGVIDHQVHHQLHAAGVNALQHAVKIGHGAEFLHDVAVIRDVVAVVIIGRGEERAEPQHRDAQILQIVQMLGDTVQVADAVPIGIGKAARIDLIDHRFLPPCALFLLHCVTLLTCLIAG